MPDLLSTLRLRNIFAPTNPIGGNASPRPMDENPRINWDVNGGHGEPMDDGSDVLSTIDRIYNPEHKYSDMYQDQINKMPQRTEPGKLRRVFGFMSGLGQNGPQNQDMVKYGKYYRNLSDWDAKTKAILPGMTAERSENANERMLAGTTVANLLRDRDITRKINTDQANVDIRQQRADAYTNNLKFQQTHPKHQLSAVAGGNYYWFNPEDPSEDPIDTGIKTGTLSKLEEINLNQGNALKRIAAQGAETRKTESVKDANEKENITLRGEESRKTKGSPTDTGSETTTETTVTDAEGKPVGTRKTKTVKKPTVTYHRMRYTDKSGKTQFIRVPKDKVKEATGKGAIDLGEVK